MAIKKTMMGCGCFWCFEAVFQRLNGVTEVNSGFAGGAIESPSYEQVCTGTTGHAEVLEISYDDEIIAFKTLLDVFFSIHNPTTLNRQGADRGTQYRSIIFYTNDTQKLECERVIQQLNQSKKWDSPIVTELSSSAIFYSAGDYHKNYYNEHSEQGYCQTVIYPKIIKLTKDYTPLLKS